MRSSSNRPTHLKDRILSSIGRRKDKAFLRQEFNGFGPRSSVDKAVRALVKEGRLVRLGYGVYAPAEGGLPTVKESEAVLEALGKLGADPQWGDAAWRAYLSGRTTQVPPYPAVTVKKPVRRRLGRGKLIYRYEYAQP